MPKDPLRCICVYISTPIYSEKTYTDEVMQMERMHEGRCGCAGSRMGMRRIMSEDFEDLEDYKEELEEQIMVLQKRLSRINSREKSKVE
jgi:hypothetical protein